jgi:hypothetical protein
MAPHWQPPVWVDLSLCGSVIEVPADGLFDFEENDRSIAERDTVGGLKLYLDAKGKVIGASCLGSQAGEIINTVSLAMAGKLKLSQISGMISPYPTRTEVVKRTASSNFTEAIFGPKARALAGFWAKFQ